MRISKSFELAKGYLGKDVEVVIDRPLGDAHPKHGFIYEVNYGYVPDTKAPDGEELDAYYLGVDVPLKRAWGKCVAIIHRTDDDDDKLVVVSGGVEMTDTEIMEQVHFQEKWFESTVIKTSQKDLM